MPYRKGRLGGAQEVARLKQCNLVDHCHEHVTDTVLEMLSRLEGLLSLLRLLAPLSLLPTGLQGGGLQGHSFRPSGRLQQ
jgi:hypothetical protein